MVFILLNNIIIINKKSQVKQKISCPKMNKFTQYPLVLLLFLLLCCNDNETRRETMDITNKNLDSATIPKNNFPQNTTNRTNPLGSNDSKMFTSKKQNLKSTINSVTKANITENQNFMAEKIIDSPLKNLFKNGEIGKTYSKEALIKEYNFPKESLGFVKKVTYTSHNTLYFHWGSTWFIERISDAKFKNGPMIFDFKKDRTLIKGGAIGIKYNKKTHTELIIKNGNAYIPSVKGYRWEIKKQ